MNRELPTQMRALVLDVDNKGYEAGHGFVTRSVPTPSLDEQRHPADADYVLLKTHSAGVCGSDKGLWFRRAFGDLVTESLAKEGKSWRVPGHEFLGEVVALGSQAREKFPFRPGDTVVAESHIFCGVCYQCRHGERHICQAMQIIGFSRDGCFAEYIKLPVNVLWKTNLNKIRPEVAAIQEPLGNAVHVCSVVNLQQKSLLVSGCGTIGLFAIALARQLQAKTIIGIDTSDKQLELAKRMGADQVLKVNTTAGQEAHRADPALIMAIRKMTSNVGVDVALEMAGFNNSFNNCVQATRRGGDTVLFGMKSGDFVVENYEELIWSCKRLQSVAGRRLFETWQLMNELLERHPELQEKIYDVVLNRGNGTVLSFADFTPERFEKMMQDHMKTIIKFP